MLLIEIVVLAGLGWFGVKEPIKKKWWKELIVFSIIFLIGATLLILQTLDVKLPFIIDGINNFFKNTLHLSYD